MAKRYRKTPNHWPFIVHAAEGTGETERAEVQHLDDLGVLSHRTLLVHAVAAEFPELQTIRRRGASVAWCPTSNLFTLGRTLTAGALRSGVLIALGTDSAITAEGDMIDELRVARASAGLCADEIFRSVTANPAKALRLTEGQGAIREGGMADLVVVKDKRQTPAEALNDLHPELVLVGGRVKLASERFAEFAGGGFHPIGTEGRGRWLIRAPIPHLRAASVAALTPEIRLAGRRLCF